MIKRNREVVKSIRNSLVDKRIIYIDNVISYVVKNLSLNVKKKLVSIDIDICDWGDTTIGYTDKIKEEFVKIIDSIRDRFKKNVHLNIWIDHSKDRGKKLVIESTLTE